MLGESALLLGRGVRSACGRHGVHFPFAQVAAVLRSADLAFCNLECVLSDCGLDPCSVCSRSMRGSPDSVTGLASAGFRVVSLANNHWMDHGRAALFDTTSRLRQHGIRPVGDGSDEPGAPPVVLSIGGVRLAFLAHNLVGGAVRRRSLTTMPGLLEEVAAARSACDAVVVSLHWGEEYMTAPAAWQVELGRRAIDSGASLVLGHHPHVVQPVEHYRRGLIAYSLGNFVCDMRWGCTRQSAVLLVELGADGVGAYKAMPVELNRRWQPVVSIIEPREHCTQGGLLGGAGGGTLQSGEVRDGVVRYRLARARVRARYRLHLAMEVCTALARYPLRWKLQVLRLMLGVDNGIGSGEIDVSLAGRESTCESSREASKSGVRTWRERCSDRNARETQGARPTLFVVCGLSDGLLPILLRPIGTAGHVQELFVFRSVAGPALPGMTYVCPPRWLARFGRLAFAWKAIALWLMALRLRPALVHGLLLVPHGLLAALAGLVTGTPWGVTLIAGPADFYALGERAAPLDAPRPPRFTGRLLLRLCRRAAVVGVLNAATAAFLRSHGIPTERITLLPDAVDSQRFRPMPKATPYDLVSVSRLAPVKHVETVLRITAALRPRFPAISTAIVGDGDLLPALRALAGELGVDDCVHFLGYRDDVPELLNSSRVFLMTSEREGGPMSLLEAMACGIPPVTSNCGIVPDLCTHGENAWVVEDYRDVGAFCAGAAALLTDPVLYRRMSAAARRAAESRTLERSAQAWAGVLERLM
jgi:gamma-polyglutamate biosynthesis protein CapA